MAEQLLNGQQRWECPNCDSTHVTALAAPHAPFHNCPGLSGLLAPYVQAGTRAKVEAVTRADYVAGEEGLRYVGGRPVMSVVTTRDDGQDCMVFPGSATAIKEQ